MHLAMQALSLASLQACHWNKEANITNKRNIRVDSFVSHLFIITIGTFPTMQLDN